LEVKAQSVRFLGQRGDGAMSGPVPHSMPAAASNAEVQDEDIPF
jgi:hypothetical protein